MPRFKIVLQYNSIYIILLLLIIATSFLRIKYYNYSSQIDITKPFIGIVTKIDYKNNKYKIIIKNKEKIIGYLKEYHKDLKIGDKVLIEGNYYKPSNNTIPNTFNYQKYLKYQKIYYIMNIKKINILKKNNNIIYKIKNYINERIDTLGDNKEYIRSFIIGNKTNLDSYNLYQENGISHLFALSGMHISLLTGILYFIFKKYRYHLIIIIFILLLYLLITDYSVSLLRTFIFFILFKINNKYDLNTTPKNILFITVSILLIINPFNLYNYGFLYSSIITYGLIITSKYLKKHYLYNLLLISIICFLFSLPITISLNNEINITSILNNIILVPLISLLIYPLSIITFLIPFLVPLFNLLITVLEKINLLLNYLSLNIIIPKTSKIIYLIYYLLLILFVKSNNTKYLLLSIITILLLKIKPLINNNYQIYYLDVNQGDSILLTHKNKTILIDSGGLNNYNYSDNTIKLLKSLGYSHLNYYITSHGDADHLGESINLINNYKVDKVIFNCGDYNELEQELIKELNKKRMKYYSCIKELNIDNNKLYFLQTKEYDNENDNSNVIYTELNGYKFMFMGDAGIDKEKDILNKYNISNIDVLKVGHHGSKTSSSKDFINEINPKYSIISVGKYNKYGHPNKEVLDNLDNSKIYRTDLDGSIIFKIKNNKLKKEHTGQIQTYMNYIDKKIKTIEDNDTVGIIICKQDNEYVIKYCSDDRIISREYELI